MKSDRKEYYREYNKKHPERLNRGYTKGYRNGNVKDGPIKNNTRVNNGLSNEILFHEMIWHDDDWCEDVD